MTEPTRLLCAFPHYADACDKGDRCDGPHADRSLDYGTCDESGCLFEYAIASSVDHCADEGVCWEHCSPAAHAPGADPLLYRLAADLLETHNATGISLDNWTSARTFVERYMGPITPNGA